MKDTGDKTLIESIEKYNIDNLKGCRECKCMLVSLFLSDFTHNDINNMHIRWRGADDGDLGAVYPGGR